ncbi:MAG: gliding motility-associated C-terminal domain-containing protein [Bacteroidota bacterium]|nr:gliding motility-associated C-terminal domain-containing protein [Bacteroidota bacterium]
MKPGRFLFLAIIFLSVSVLLSAQNRGITINNFDLPQLKFEENKNQFDSRVLYQSDIARGGRLYLEKNCFTYLFWNADQIAEMRHPHTNVSDAAANRNDSTRVDFHCFKAQFLGANPDPYVSAQYPMAYYRNYFVGNDKNKWASDVHLYTEVNYAELYPSIDLRVYNKNQQLEYDYIVNDGGDVNAIRVQYSGADKIYLEDGNLVIRTSQGSITEQKPQAYQLIDGREVNVRCSFHLEGNIVSFNFPDGYDQSLPLIIDPTLIVSTFSGSTTDNWGYTATYDNAGNIYAGGIANGPGFPVTAGAFQAVFGGGGTGGNFYAFDIALTKYDPTGSSLLFSTYLGGSDNEQPNSIVVDAANNLCVVGRTYSSNFPTTAGAYDVSFNGGADIIVTKFNPAGTALIGSTYMGGTGDDGVNIAADFFTCTSLKFNYGDDGRSDINADNAGNCYIASNTQSANFPVTAGAFQTGFGGGLQDGCVFKMNSTLTALVFSSFLGGNADDAVYSIALNSSNEIYVSGGTSSTNFPTTPGTIHTTYQGGIADGFAVHFDPTGSAVLQSSFIGTTGYDQAYFIQLDAGNNIYLYGQTSGAYPVSAGVYSVPNSGQFIHKLDPVLSSTVYSTVFGSGTLSPDISPAAFLVDTCENVYTSGWGGQCIGIGFQGTTIGLPTTANAFQSTTDGCDFYFFVLKKNAVTLWYASFFGGGGGSEEHVDGGTSRFDKRGVIYQSVCAGCAGGAFPTTAGSWSPTNGSFNCNNAVIKLDFQLININAVAAAAPSDTICTGSTMNFINTSTGAVNYVWDFGDGSPLDTNAVPSHQYNITGSFTVTLIAIDSLSCVISDTTQLVVEVVAPPLVNLGNDTTICGPINMQLNAGNVGSTYTWSTGATSQTITVTAQGNYWVIADNGSCTDQDSINIQSFTAPNLGSDTTLCVGFPLTLDAGNPGSTYLWNTGASTQTIFVNTTGTYYVTSSSGICSLADTVDVTFIPAPVVNLGNDTVLCPNQTFTLDAGNPGFNYNWNTGEQTQTIIASGTSLFSVVVSNSGCSASDSVSVRTLSGVDLGSDVNLCDFLSIEIAAPDLDGATYLWSTGQTTTTIQVTEPGTYSVNVLFGSCSLRDTLVVEGGYGSPALYVPNSFTPNKDALNDVFFAEGTDITSFRMRIFDRWGELLFESSDIYDGWDGFYKGEKVPNDVYVVVTDYTTTCTGNATVHRITHVTVTR